MRYADIAYDDAGLQQFRRQSSCLMQFISGLTREMSERHNVSISQLWPDFDDAGPLGAVAEELVFRWISWNIAHREITNVVVGYVLRCKEKQAKVSGQDLAISFIEWMKWREDTMRDTLQR